MIHVITLRQEDYITFQLYEASTNPVKIKSRNKSYLISIGIAILIAVLGYLIKSDFLFYYSLIIAFIHIIFGKKYLKWRHKRHYVKHVRDQRKNIESEKVEIEISDEFITCVDRTGSSTIKISEFEVVNEIASHFLIKLRTGPMIIIPKTDANLNQEILEMSQKHQVTHVRRLDWKW